ncbi:MAG: phosphotransferase family protein [Dehalococcoidia bacterium]
MTDDDAFAIESGWTRREPFVQLAPERIASLLAPVFGARIIESIQPLSGGLANTNYRVQVAGTARPVVLRLYTRDRHACARDVALFELVAGGVPTPELLFADTAGDRFAHPYAIMTWIDGPPLAEALAAEPGAAFDLGQAAGAALPAIGSHRFEQPGEFASDLSVLPPPAQGPLTFLDHIESCLARTSDAALVSTAFIEHQ